MPRDGSTLSLVRYTEGIDGVRSAFTRLTSVMLNKDFLLYLPVGTRILRHTSCRKLLCEMLSISVAVWLSTMPSGIPN